MKKLRLLPRWMRVLGLGMVLPCIFLFAKDPEIVFGDANFFGSQTESYWKATVPALLDQSSGDETGEFVWMSWVENDISNELMLSLMLLGTYFIAFAKVKGEDEFSYQLRMEAMSLSHLLNGALLLIANWLFYDGIFLYVLIWGLFSFLLIFSTVFALKLRSQRKSLGHEE